MAIRMAVITGYEPVDLELAYMVKWQINGSASMAFNHSTRAGMLLLAAIADGKATQKNAQEFIKFVGEVLYGVKPADG